jgi:hypothetical protein
MRPVLKVLARRTTPWTLVTLREQQLGEVRAVLAGDER